MWKYFIYLCLLLPVYAVAQNVTGRVVDANNNPLPGASISWLNNKKGTVASGDGNFSIKKQETNSTLVASHIGYITDTIDVSNMANVLFVLKTKENLEGVQVTAEKAGTVMSKPNWQKQPVVIWRVVLKHNHRCSHKQPM